MCLNTQIRIIAKICVHTAVYIHNAICINSNSKLLQHLEEVENCGCEGAESESMIARKSESSTSGWSIRVWLGSLGIRALRQRAPTRAIEVNL